MIRGRINLLYDFGRNDLAGAAPGSKGIKDYDLVVVDGRLKFGLAVKAQLLASFTPTPTRRLCRTAS